MVRIQYPIARLHVTTPRFVSLDFTDCFPSPDAPLSSAVHCCGVPNPLGWLSASSPAIITLSFASADCIHGAPIAKKGIVKSGLSDDDDDDDEGDNATGLLMESLSDLDIEISWSRVDSFWDHRSGMGGKRITHTFIHI